MMRINWNKAATCVPVTARYVSESTEEEDHTLQAEKECQALTCFFGTQERMWGGRSVYISAKPKSQKPKIMGYWRMAWNTKKYPKSKTLNL